MVFNLLIISRRIKLIGVIILAVICFFMVRHLRTTKLIEIYSYQASIADVLDLEIRYMPKDITFEDDVWIPAENLDGHIFSAYLDIRPEIILENSRSRNEIIWAEIRIIAILPLDTNPSQVQCVFKYESNDNGYIYQRRRATDIKAMEEHWDLKYSAFFVICQLFHQRKFNYNLIYHEKQLPKSVGICLNSSKNMSINFIDIHYPKNGISQFYKKPEKFLALCVPVLHHKFDYPLELIEFMEFYRLMGVNHFTFYNASISHDVSRVLQFYREIDIATVLTWILPQSYIYEQTLRHEGLFAALNDCHYRNTFYDSYKYVATFDFDEFLVPRKHDNFIALMEYLDPWLSQEHDGDYASFVFRNVYFYTMYPDDKGVSSQGEIIIHEIIGQDPYLRTRKKIYRLKQPHPGLERSRYITRGRDVIEIGNYQTWKLRPGSSTSETKQFYEKVVEPDVALSHHYAPCEAEETGCYLKSIEIDRTAQKFSNELSNSVSNICKLIFGEIKCPLSKQQLRPS